MADGGEDKGVNAITCCHSCCKALLIFLVCIMMVKVSSGLQHDCVSFKMVREFDEESSYASNGQASDILHDFMGDDFESASFAPECYLFVCKDSAFAEQLAKTSIAIELGDIVIGVNVSQTFRADASATGAGHAEGHVTIQGSLLNYTANLSTNHSQGADIGEQPIGQAVQEVCDNTLFARAAQEPDENETFVEYSLMGKDGMAWKSGCADTFWAGDSPRYRSWTIPGDGWDQSVLWVSAMWGITRILILFLDTIVVASLHGTVASVFSGLFMLCNVFVLPLMMLPMKSLLPDAVCGQLITLSFSSATWITSSVYGSFVCLFAFIGLCPIFYVAVARREEQMKRLALGLLCWVCSSCCMIPVAIVIMAIHTYRHLHHTLRFMSWSWVFSFDFHALLELRSFDIDLVMSANTLQVLSFILLLMDLMNGMVLKSSIKIFAKLAKLLAKSKAPPTNQVHAL